MKFRLEVISVLVPYAVGLFLVNPTVAAEWTGEFGIEMRYFPHDGVQPRQFDGAAVSTYVLPEFYHSWNDGSDSLVFEPFLRADQHDPRRSHGDVRELHWRHVADNWELKIGISTVFWGVTESLHLVDIINQTDAVENIDGEDKLGQPMAQLRLARDWGTLDLFVLPGFREREFPGPEGRLSPASISASEATYESSAKQSHTDLAVRWAHSVGDIDIGLSYFHGTSREPRFALAAETLVQLQPYYDQIEQSGLDVQLTSGAWLWKLETIYRAGQGRDFIAAVAGFEYSLFAMLGGDAEIGLLLEYQFDQRADQRNFGPFNPPGPDNDVFIGTRLGFNDTQSSALLAGCSFDLDSAARFCIAEGSRRLNDQWVVSLEARMFSNAGINHPAWALRNDDHWQLDLTYHF